MKTVEVHNLSNDQVSTYTDMLPSEAVIYAYLNSIGRRNTWEYQRLYLEYYKKLSWGKFCVAMGDFCASTNEKTILSF
jgi:hypothetical protein